MRFSLVVLSASLAAAANLPTRTVLVTETAEAGPPLTVTVTSSMTLDTATPERITDGDAWVTGSKSKLPGFSGSETYVTLFDPFGDRPAGPWAASILGSEKDSTTYQIVPTLSVGGYYEEYLHITEVITAAPTTFMVAQYLTGAYWSSRPADERPYFETFSLWCSMSGTTRAECTSSFMGGISPEEMGTRTPTTFTQLSSVSFELLNQAPLTTSGSSGSSNAVQTGASSSASSLTQSPSGSIVSVSRGTGSPTPTPTASSSSASKSCTFGMVAMFGVLAVNLSSI